MTQQWHGLIRRYNGKSGKLQSRLELPIHMWTYMWLNEWPPHRKIPYWRPQSSDFQPESAGSETSARRWCEHRRGKGYPWRAEKLMLYQGAFYHCHTLPGKLKEVLWFIVPTAHWVAAMSGCHLDAGHQGQQRTLHLLQDQSWWPSMAMQMQKVISNCKQCIQYEGTWVKAPMQPIIATAPLEIATHGFHKHWDDYGVRPTTKCSASVLVFCAVTLQNMS